MAELNCDGRDIDLEEQKKVASCIVQEIENIPRNWLAGLDKMVCFLPSMLHIALMLWLHPQKGYEECKELITN